MTWPTIRLWSEARIAAVVVAGTIVTAIAPAATLRVERDGSGDYTAIQDAINAAASGDTIRIGTGRFNEQQLVTCPGWSEMVRVLVKQDTLTIIGSGPETVIGQAEPYEWSQGYHKGIVASDYWGNSCLRVENVSVENVRDGIYTGYESMGHDYIEVRNCRFIDNDCSLFLYGDGGKVKVEGCEFRGLATNLSHVYSYGQSRIDVSDCDFWISLDTNWGPRHIAFEFCGDASVKNCVFRGGQGGVSVQGASADIENCTFYGQSLYGLAPYAGANVHVSSSSFLWQYRAVVSFTSNDTIQVDNTVFQNISQTVFWIGYAGSLRVNHCDLAGGADGIVNGWTEYPPNPIKTFNMEDNYWGTDDPQVIRDLIYDQSDNSRVLFHVDFEPFANESTPAEKKSLGDIKAGFR